jgi:hypothetical protein
MKTLQWIRTRAFRQAASFLLASPCAQRRRHRNCDSGKDRGYSDVIEFTDGKLVCGKQQSVSELSWQSIQNALSLDDLSEVVRQAGLIAFVDWGIVLSMTDIMDQFLHHVGDRLLGPRKPLFIDTTDPAKRSEADILGLVHILPRLAHKFEVSRRICLDSKR